MNIFLKTSYLRGIEHKIVTKIENKIKKMSEVAILKQYNTK